MTRYSLGELEYLDFTPGAVVVRARIDGRGGPRGLELTFASGAVFTVGGDYSEKLWESLTAGAVPVPLPPAPVPPPPSRPPFVPDGFGAPGPPASPSPVPTVPGPSVVLDPGPNHGGAFVLVMTGRTERPEETWLTKPGGDDVYLLGLDPKRKWAAYLNGEYRELSTDERGYAWLFAKGPRAWLGLVSTARPG